MEDKRTSSFLHFLDILEKVNTPPNMILLENVSGFETSEARNRLLEVLSKQKYKWQVSLLMY